MESAQAIERQIVEKKLTHPRVSLPEIEANIVGEYYFTAADGVEGSGYTKAGYDPRLRWLTFCVIVLKNGFTVTGKSACASPENFDAEIGKKIARQNAVNEIWPLMGYSLLEKLNKPSV